MMMLQGTKEEQELYEKLRKATTKEEIEQIQKKLAEIYKKQREELKDCPFVH